MAPCQWLRGLGGAARRRASAGGLAWKRPPLRLHLSTGPAGAPTPLDSAEEARPAQSASRLPAFLLKEAIVAEPGFNRLYAVVPAIATNICGGSVYAWSIFNGPLTKELGVVASCSADWSLVSRAHLLFGTGFPAHVYNNIRKLVRGRRPPTAALSWQATPHRTHRARGSYRVRRPPRPYSQAEVVPVFSLNAACLGACTFATGKWREAGSCSFETLCHVPQTVAEF